MKKDKVKGLTKEEIIENCIETYNAIDYFTSYRMEELKSDDQFYIQHLIKHIKYLEARIIAKDEVFNKMNNHLKENFFDKDGTAKRIYTKS